MRIATVDRTIISNSWSRGNQFDLEVLYVFQDHSPRIPSVRRFWYSGAWTQFGTWAELCPLFCFQSVPVLILAFFFGSILTCIEVDIDRIPSNLGRIGCGWARPGMRSNQIDSAHTDLTCVPGNLPSVKFQVKPVHCISWKCCESLTGETGPQNSLSWSRWSNPNYSKGWKQSERFLVFNSMDKLVLFVWRVIIGQFQNLPNKKYELTSPVEIRTTRMYCDIQSDLCFTFSINTGTGTDHLSSLPVLLLNSTELVFSSWSVFILIYTFWSSINTNN